MFDVPNNVKRVVNYYIPNPILGPLKILGAPIVLRVGNNVTKIEQTDVWDGFPYGYVNHFYIESNPNIQKIVEQDILEVINQ